MVLGIHAARRSTSGRGSPCIGHCLAYQPGTRGTHGVAWLAGQSSSKLAKAVLFRLRHDTGRSPLCPSLSPIFRAEDGQLNQMVCTAQLAPPLSYAWSGLHRNIGSQARRCPLRYSSSSQLHFKLGHHKDEPSWSIYLTSTETSPTRLSSLRLRHITQPRKLSSYPRLLHRVPSPPTSRRHSGMSGGRHTVHLLYYTRIVPLLI